MVKISEEVKLSSHTILSNSYLCLVHVRLGFHTGGASY